MLSQCSGRSLNQGRYEGWRSQFENPTWRVVVRLAARSATLTEIDSIGQLNIGMALLTEASNHLWFP
jgi:hypothetical protein